jgi:hypothetical protein
MLRAAEDLKHIVKVGQYPPPDIAVGKHLARTLGDYEDLYRKGITCERFGYGIGAYAYYRRVVESIIGKLLGLVGEIIPVEERAIYEEALRNIEASIVARERIRLVKDLLPQASRPDGLNPLGILYDALSDGIHDLSDEECLQHAVSVRSVLTFIVEKVENERRVKGEFTAAMRSLLDRKGPGRPN